jgi:uncharacterized FAD-dependent dehydrogenase
MDRQAPSATWRVMNVELALGEPESLLRERAARAVGFEPRELRGFRIARKALDARVRGGERRMRWICHADLVVDAQPKPQALERALRTGQAKAAPLAGSVEREVRHASLFRPETAPVVIVGSGPAGVFAAHVLARNGVRCVVLERGPEIAERGRAVVRFHRTREVDRERNLLFGEGGAGTYSDGKIYTRVDDPLEVPLLEELVACGAPEAIVYDSLAHIGTDRLHRVLPALRRRLIDLGVEFRFDTRFERLVLAPGGDSVRAVVTNHGELACGALILAVGHSARDTTQVLAKQGLTFEAKPFQLGVRIEHPQDLIDSGRFGARVPELGAASYGLVCKASDSTPAAYSFCMCPGGRMVASVNEPGLLCTNGMSNSKHSSAWASSAIVTTLGPEHFGREPFDGVRFQRELEARFFEVGGGDFTAPAQGAADFLSARTSSETRHSTYTFGTVPARIDQLLPSLARDAIARALSYFDRQIRHFASNEGELVGIESRSSGPVRMPRDPATRRALRFDNIYPVGEGAGYAGGIMSAALDGANSALALLALGVPAR